MPETPITLTSAEFRELERLSRKAAHYEKERGNERNYDTLIGVAYYADRRA